MPEPQVKTLKSYSIQFFLKYKIYLLSLISLAILGAIFDISVNYKIKEIIDDIAYGSDYSLMHLCISFVVLKFILHAVFFIVMVLDWHYMPNILEYCVKDMYKKTTKHSLQWFESNLSGEISSKVTDFQQSIRTLVKSCFGITNNIAVICISIIFLLEINTKPSLILLVFVLTYTPVIYLLLKKQMVLQEKAMSSRQNTIGIINDSIANIFGIKIIGNLGNELKQKLLPSLKNWKLWDKKTKHFDAYYIDLADTLMVTLMTTVQVFVIAYLYQSGEITAGEFTFIMMITFSMHLQLDQFLEHLLFSINPAIAELKSSYNFIVSEYTVQDKENAVDIKKVKGEISFENVSFSYNKVNNILDNFNLKIKKGETIGIVGTSGAGKTTLTKSLLRYFDIDQGAIKIDSQNIADLSQESLRSHISIIPQDINMFHRTIYENLKIAKYDATEKQIIEACKKAKIHQDIMSMPDGYESVVGERGVKVSGGQRQRIAIARAILKNAPILILDEATSSLDTETERLIQESISDLLLTKEATVIAIAHRLSTLKNMDRIIVLDKGKIVEEGTHNSLIRKKDGFYKKLWDMQVI